MDMEKKIYVASKNLHKIKEISEILKSSGFETKGFPNLPEIEETGSTFEENACIKAGFLSKLTDCPVIADDSGLEVSALGGAPGVYSARYAGIHGDDEANNRKLLKNMEWEADRQCKFICVIALAFRGEIINIFRGEAVGMLGFEEKGDNGFGYDTLFITDNGKTMAELAPEEKNRISHRNGALKLLEGFLKNRGNYGYFGF